MFKQKWIHPRLRFSKYTQKFPFHCSYPMSCRKSFIDCLSNRVNLNAIHFTCQRGLSVSIKSAFPSASSSKTLTIVFATNSLSTKVSGIPDIGKVWLKLLMNCLISESGNCEYMWRRVFGMKHIFNLETTQKSSCFAWTSTVSEHAPERCGD